MKDLISAAFLCVPLVMAGCGGGGGGSRLAQPQEMPHQPQPPQPPPPPLQPPQPPPAPQPPVAMPDCIETADYGCIDVQEYDARRQGIEDTHNGEESFLNQWGLGAVGADRAWAQLELELGAGAEPGGGITVGLIDTGIDIGHPVFAGKTVTEHFFSGTEDEDGTESSHGTGVAGVIAGRPGDMFTADVNAARGVAWGADIAMFAVPTGLPGDVYDPIELSSLGSVGDGWKDRLETILGWSSDGGTLDFRERQPELSGDHRTVQRAAAPRQSGRLDRRARPRRRERKDRFRLVRRQRPRSALQCSGLHGQPGSLRQREGRCEVGRGPGGPAGPDRRTARTHDLRCCDHTGWRDRPFLQSLRHLRGVVPRRARRGDSDGLFRSR